MKTRYFILLALVAVLFAACSDPLKEPVSFDVEIENAQSYQFVDTAYVIPAGTELTFNFDGEPDFISFTYDRFLPTNASLEFTVQAAWGTHIENTLAVLVSDSFEGLVLDDFTKDSQNIKAAEWKDLSAEADLPVAANQSKDVKINLNDYRGKDMVLAFRYKTSFAEDWQPSWTISDLEMVNSRITDNSFVSNILAATMGFAPFDMLNSDDAYNNEYLSGVWDATNPVSMRMRQTARNNELNEDWLVTKPINVSAGLIEKSVSQGVKNTTLRVESYTYKFDNVGEYVLTFKASNHNYRYQSDVERVINVNVVD